MGTLRLLVDHYASADAKISLFRSLFVDNAVILTFDLDFGDILALGVLDRPSVVMSD